VVKNHNNFRFNHTTWIDLLASQRDMFDLKRFFGSKVPILGVLLDDQIPSVHDNLIDPIIPMKAG
jgi:hypothetical protein